MLVLSAFPFWLRVFGPFRAGLVGGKKAGGVGPAPAAVFLPLFLMAAVLLVLGSGVTGIPLLGLVAAAGSLLVAVTHVGALLVGAIVGGLIS